MLKKLKCMNEIRINLFLFMISLFYHKFKLSFLSNVRVRILTEKGVMLMKKLHYIFMTVFCILLVCSGCGKKAEIKSSPFLDHIQLSVNEKSLTNKNNTHVYQVSLVNSDGKEVDVDSVNFKMEMKSMNHHVEASMKKINKGIYEVSLELPMEGTWSKQITLKKGKNERKVSIR